MLKWSNTLQITVHHIMLVGRSVIGLTEHYFRGTVVTASVVAGYGMCDICCLVTIYAWLLWQYLSLGMQYRVVVLYVKGVWDMMKSVKSGICSLMHLR
jgi:hypothetical protein